MAAMLPTLIRSDRLRIECEFLSSHVAFRWVDR